MLPIPQILIVQHDPSLRYVMAEAMEDLGVRTTAVPSGVLAIAMVATQRFDMALINVSLPEGLSGVELAKISAKET